MGFLDEMGLDQPGVDEQSWVSTPPGFDPNTIKDLDVTMLPVSQFGFSPGITQQFVQSGYNELPAWMSTFAQHPDRYEINNIVDAYSKIVGRDPLTIKDGHGKAGSSLLNMGFRVKDGQLVNAFGNTPFTEDWTPQHQGMLESMYLGQKLRPNTGGLFSGENLLGMMAGLGAVAAPIAGLGALGGFAGLGAAPALGAVGGTELSTALAGLSPAQIAAEFPAMAGTSLTGAAATPGFFGSGIGVGADAALGGLFGTGVGLSNLPAAGGLGAMLSGGWDKLTGALGGIDWSKLAGAIPGLFGVGVAPTPLYAGMPGVSGGSPQVSPIPQDTGMGGPSRMVGGVMPTASVMGAYGDDKEKNRLDYFRSIF